MESTIVKRKTHNVRDKLVEELQGEQVSDLHK